MPMTLRGSIARLGVSMLILAIPFLTSLMVETSCDGVGFRRISSHPAGAMRASARLPGPSDSGERIVVCPYLFSKDVTE